MNWPAHREALRRWGLRRFLYGLLMGRLQRHGLRLFFIFRRSHHGVATTHQAGDQIEMRIVEWDELFRYADDPAMELDGAFLRDAKARGDICVGAFDEGRLVAYIWRAFQPLPAADGFWVRFDPPNRYGYNAFTLPSHRGKHLQGALAPATDPLLTERGYTHAIGYIESHNFASIRSALRQDNVRIGYAGSISLMGRRRTFSSKGARQQGFFFFDPGASE